MFLVTGVLAALLSARTTGVGQVVDAAMTDGVASMSALVHAFRANGLWSDTRQDNLLDGAAPFYRCYACQDGRFVAVGALEPVFFKQLIAALGLAPDTFAQNDRSGWPEMERQFTALFASRTRDAWTEVFAATDACVTPVLTWDEAADHPHNSARATFIGRNGVTQPAPAPRFSATPGAITEPVTATVAQVAARWLQPVS